jgi:hypothetical protein
MAHDSLLDGFTDDLAQYFVDFIDDLYAEQAVAITGDGMAMFYAHSRLDGAFSLACLVEAPEGAIAVLNRARERYAALMDGAGIGTEPLRREHERCLAEVRQRRVRVAA